MNWAIVDEEGGLVFVGSGTKAEANELVDLFEVCDHMQYRARPCNEIADGDLKTEVAGFAHDLTREPFT